MTTTRWTLADVNGPVAYFGHKVLAVSYGGTLQLFGAEGRNLHRHSATGCQENSSVLHGDELGSLE